MKICAACTQELPQSSFSNNQWQLKQSQRRCKSCIEANRVVNIQPRIGEHRSMDELQVLVYKELGDKALDYRALNEVWRATTDPFFYTSLDRLVSKREATPAILSNGSFVCVKSSDAPSNFCYTMEDDDDNNNLFSFGDNSVKMEYTERHPGVYPPEGSMSMPFNPFTSVRSFKPIQHMPITTTASKYLFSVALAGENGRDAVEMKAAYRHQLSLRIDENASSPSLNLDCFEYSPTCLDVTDTESPYLPTYGELRNFDDMTEGIERCSSHHGWLNTTVERGPSDSTLALNYQALAGKFMGSRSFRLRVDLSNVAGIRLMSGGENAKFDGPNDVAAVLVIETKEDLELDEKSFAVRTVCSNRSDEKFTLCPDWTPHFSASTAKRFYFFGGLGELKQTAAIVSRLCPDIAKMLRSQMYGGNSLASGAQVTYDSPLDDDIASVSSDIYPLPPASWDGTIKNSRDMFETLLAREEDPTKRMMLRMMADPESVIAINQDPNSSIQDKMLSKLVAQQVLSGHSGSDDGCCVM